MKIRKKVRIRICKRVKKRIMMKIGIGTGKLKMIRMSNLIPSTIGKKIGMMKKTSMRKIF